jgi:S-adenosylmethionine/arginine decarboxylase-like enzyme
LGNDIEGAVLAAQASCNLSKNTSSESFHVLAEVYKKKQDVLGEIQALQKMLSLPPPSSTTVVAAASVRNQRLQQFAVENQRRIASIRLQKLEREYQGQDNSRP